MGDSVMCEVMVGPRRTESSGGDGFTYQWGRIEDGKRDSTFVLISPAALVPPDMDPEIEDGGLVTFSSLRSAKVYAAHRGAECATRLVIVTRIGQGVDEPALVRVERADPAGWQATMTFVSSLVGFGKRPLDGTSSRETHVSVRERMRLLRAAKQSGNTVEVDYLSEQIAVDFRDRHYRKV